MEWFSVHDSMPEDGKHVLLFVLDRGEKLIVTGWKDVEGWCIGNHYLVWDFHFNLDLSYSDITHWAEMPQKPNKE